MKTPEIVSRKRILDEFFAVEKVEIRHEESEETLLRYIVVPKEAVAVILYRKDNNSLVFSKQYRLAAQKWLIEIPAGVIDKNNENPEETACRECLEETGYEVNNPEFITTFFPSPGNSAERIHLYFAQVKGKDKIEKGGGLDTENEHIKVVEINLHEAITMAEKGEITDGKTLMGILWLDKKLNRK
ncbi:MAG: NUDIX hydrolase [Sphingobacteriales bacterium]|nr:MAG: NUDIX hydrolase [Sphingobacteriales bacterium]